MRCVLLALFFPKPNNTRGVRRQLEINLNHTCTLDFIKNCRSDSKESISDSLIQLGGHRPLLSRRRHGRGLVVLNQEGRREVEVAPQERGGRPLPPLPQDPAGQHRLQQEKDSTAILRCTLNTQREFHGV